MNQTWQSTPNFPSHNATQDPLAHITPTHSARSRKLLVEESKRFSPVQKHIRRRMDTQMAHCDHNENSQRDLHPRPRYEPRVRHHRPPKAAE